MRVSKINIALAGNPNSGKSTLFNSLTGLTQKVGNYPGITVDKRTGNATLSRDIKATVTDLPGTYSLFAKSMDEKVAQQVLCNTEEPDYPDIVVVIADATNLRRSVFLLTQIIDLNMDVVLALNMVDIATKKGLIINVDLLAEELGIPVIAINARKGSGIKRLTETIVNKLEKSSKRPFLLVDKLFNNNVIEKANKIRGIDNDYASFLALCKQKIGGEKHNRVALDNLCKDNDIIPERIQARETVRRYKVIDKVISTAVKQGKPTGNYLFTLLDNINNLNTVSSRH